MKKIKYLFGFVSFALYLLHLAFKKIFYNLQLKMYLQFF